MITTLSRWPALLLALAGCAAPAGPADELQGVAELHERQLGFEFAGRLLELKVRRGQRVAKSELLAAIDGALERPQREARAQELAAARAQLALLRSGARREEVRALQAQVRGARAVESTLAEAARRSRELFAGRSIPRAQLDDAEGQLARATAEREAAEERALQARHGSRPDDLRAAEARERAAAAQLALADERLQRLELHAPLAGVVLEVPYEVGELVAAGAPVVTLADPRRPYADLFVPEARVGRLASGDRVALRADGIEGSFEGVVQDIGRRTEFTPRFLYSPKERPNLVVRVRVDIDDPHERLRAGLPLFARPSGPPATHSETPLPGPPR